MAKKRPHENKVKCPFFVKWTTTSVSCEALEAKGRCASQTFYNENALAKFVENNCCSLEPECKLYKLLMEKYSD